MSAGYHRKILRVDLSNGSIWVEEHDDTFYRRYFGGQPWTVHSMTVKR